MSLVNCRNNSFAVLLGVSGYACKSGETSSLLELIFLFFEKATKDFAELSLENQKRFLLECLDKHHLYIN